jgi:hypothetical protein
LDEAWRLDAPFYISVGGGGAAVDDRYRKFGQWLRSAIVPVELSVVGFDNGAVAFLDGRHRFAWLRDHGVLSLPVQVSAGQAEQIALEFGTTERSSVLAPDCFQRTS